MADTNPSASLLDKTLELVRERPRALTYDKIAEDTGLGKAWLEAFASGRIDDPGIRKVEALHAYLSK